MKMKSACVNVLRSQQADAKTIPEQLAALGLSLSCANLWKRDMNSSAVKFLRAPKSIEAKALGKRPRLACHATLPWLGGFLWLSWTSSPQVTGLYPILSLPRKHKRRVRKVCVLLLFALIPHTYTQLQEKACTQRYALKKCEEPLASDILLFSGTSNKSRVPSNQSALSYACSKLQGDLTGKH